MTKADIVDAVAVNVHISKRQAGEIVELILNEIRSALGRGDRVALTPFGSFVVRERRAREGRNPKTGATINIPERRVAAFIAGTALKSAIAGGKGKKTSAKR
ncbi:MAG TPA: HU family DNA-binding protein [Candidatus Baltobacteraceae bacterium]|nr:HU family DNA-binding protein [Candidatus Baltobacteraceae bacterium]